MLLQGYYGFCSIYFLHWNQASQSSDHKFTTLWVQWAENDVLRYIPSIPHSCCSQSLFLAFFDTEDKRAGTDFLQTYLSTQWSTQWSSRCNQFVHAGYLATAEFILSLLPLIKSLIITSCIMQNLTLIPNIWFCWPRQFFGINDSWKSYNFNCTHQFYIVPFCPFIESSIRNVSSTPIPSVSIQPKTSIPSFIVNKIGSMADHLPQCHCSITLA